MTSNTNSIDEIANSFSSESEKLQNIINETQKKSNELSIPEIIANYFQIMNVNSHITLLKKHMMTLDSPDSKLTEKIKETEALISEKFNKKLHPFIMSQLTKSIEESMEILQSNQSKQKSKDEIENEAKLYAALREKMSTKEFVEQYEKGLIHD